MSLCYPIIRLLAAFSSRRAGNMTIGSFLRLDGYVRHRMNIVMRLFSSLHFWPHTDTYRMWHWLFHLFRSRKRERDREKNFTMLSRWFSSSYIIVLFVLIFYERWQSFISPPSRLSLYPSLSLISPSLSLFVRQNEQDMGTWWIACVFIHRLFFF